MKVDTGNSGKNPRFFFLASLEIWLVCKIQFKISLRLVDLQDLGIKPKRRGSFRFSLFWTVKKKKTCPAKFFEVSMYLRSMCNPWQNVYFVKSDREKKLRLKIFQVLLTKNFKNSMLKRLEYKREESRKNMGAKSRQ